jgi:hypothetical protein
MEFVYKIPVITTFISGWFFVELYRHWLKRNRPPHLFWWTIGVLCYGLGTFTESIVGLLGWSEPVFKSWYILGALMGGFPLAQGSVYLFLPAATAQRMSRIMVLIISLTALCVIASPVDYTLVTPGRLTGSVLMWKQVRWVTPFINLYAFVFLVGGAVYSAYRYSRERYAPERMWGNIWIAVGALLPGVGGTFAKAGLTEVLYITELLGIILIYTGYRMMRQNRGASSLYPVQQ